MLGPARFETRELIKGAPLAGRKYARPALDDRFGIRKLLILDRVDPEIVEASKSIDRRKKADEAFHERDIGRKIKDGVGRKMVGLEFIKIKKAPEEVRRR